MTAGKWKIRPLGKTAPIYEYALKCGKNVPEIAF